MINIIPKLLLKSGETIGNELYISFPELDTNETYLTTDYAAGVTVLAVENGLKFSSGFIVIGDNGNEKCEIRYVNTTPTANSMTVTVATKHAHNRGEKIQFIPFDGIEIEYSTDKVQFFFLDNLYIRPDSKETLFIDRDGSQYVYYRIRFTNFADNTYSTYSDIVFATGYTENSAGKLIETALSDLGMDIDGRLITKRFLFDALNEARREIDEDIGIKRWSFRSVFNYKLYSIIPGQYKVTTPTDLKDPSTNKNIIKIRVGRESKDCYYFDQEELERRYMTTYHTTLAGAITSADTSISLAESGDLDESGSIYIAAAAVDEVLDAVEYTDNTEATDTISGVTGIRTAGHAYGVDVWQNATFGLPTNYTVNNGSIYFSQPFSDEFAGESVFIDYYKKIEDINSDEDILDEPFYNIYISFLRFKIKQKKDKNLDWKNDLDYIKWSNSKKAQIDKEYFGSKTRILIDITS